MRVNVRLLRLDYGSIFLKSLLKSSRFEGRPMLSAACAVTYEDGMLSISNLICPFRAAYLLE